MFKKTAPEVKEKQKTKKKKRRLFTAFNAKLMLFGVACCVLAAFLKTVFMLLFLGLLLHKKMRSRITLWASLASLTAVTAVGGVLLYHHMS